MRKGTMNRFVAAGVVGLALLTRATPVQAQTVALRCEHRSGFDEGRVFSVTVDFGSSTISVGGWMGDHSGPAEITTGYIMWRFPRQAWQRVSEAVRIDRATGVMYWNTDNRGWNTVYGTPGVVCQQGGIIGPR
jgi:hypothetical protein